MKHLLLIGSIFGVVALGSAVPNPDLFNSERKAYLIGKMDATAITTPEKASELCPLYRELQDDVKPVGFMNLPKELTENIDALCAPKGRHAPIK